MVVLGHVRFRRSCGGGSLLAPVLWNCCCGTLARPAGSSTAYECMYTLRLVIKEEVQVGRVLARYSLFDSGRDGACMRTFSIRVIGIIKRGIKEGDLAKWITTQ